MTPRHYVAMSPRMTIVASSARMCAVLPGNADTSSTSTISAHHTAPLRPAMPQPVISRSMSLRGFTRRRALSRTDASAAASCRDAVRSQRTRRTRQPAGRQLDGNDRRVHDARPAQRTALENCARRSHVAIQPSARTAQGTGCAPTSCRILAPQPRPARFAQRNKIPARFRVRGPSNIATVADLHSAAVTRHYAAASFSFFSARAFTRTLAGFAGNQRSSPVNGSLPKRFFFAGTTCAVIFSRPGSVNSPAPFL